MRALLTLTLVSLTSGGASAAPRWTDTGLESRLRDRWNAPKRAPLNAVAASVGQNLANLPQPFGVRVRFKSLSSALRNYHKPTSQQLSPGYNALFFMKGTADVTVFATKKDFEDDANGILRSSVPVEVLALMRSMEMGYVPTTWLFQYLSDCITTAAAGRSNPGQMSFSASGAIQVFPDKGRIAFFANEQKIETINCGWRTE